MASQEIPMQQVPQLDQQLGEMEKTFIRFEKRQDRRRSPVAPRHFHVGGTVADRVGIETVAHIDPIEKTLVFENEKQSSPLRSDLSIKDADTFVIWPDESAFHYAREKFAFWKVPMVSIEATPFPGWYRRPPYQQFVSGMIVDDDQRLHVTMQYMNEEISWKSVEPWTLRLRSGVELSILNPFVYLFRYVGRSPSGVKEKDTKALGFWLDAAQKAHKYSKLSLMGRLAVSTLAAGRKHGIDYLGDDYFGPWARFLYRVHNDPEPLTKLYGELTRWYWRGPGTAISHGKGPLGWLVTWQDRMGPR